MSVLEEKLADVQGQMIQVSDDLEAVATLAKNEKRDLTAEETTLMETSTARLKSLEAQASTLKSSVEARKQIETARSFQNGLTASATADNASFGIEAQRSTTIRAKSKLFDNNFEAYAVGQWLLGISGRKDSELWYQQHGTHLDARNDMSGGVDNKGGYTVPKPLAETIVRLVEQFGVFRRNARPAIMSSNTLDVPRRDAGITVSYPAEAASIDKSDLTFGQIALVARKYAALSLWSTELDEDSVISMTDILTMEIALAFSQAEDTNSFLGDGSGTYGSITGIKSALQAGAKVTASGTAASTVTMDDLNAMVGKVPQYAGVSPKWYMHSYHFYTTVQKLLQALGGTDARQVEAGAQPYLLGFPVEFCQVLPGATTAASDMLMVFGDLNLGAYSGQRRQITMRLLTELYAATDQLGMQATMRADSVIHSVGDATNAGAIVGLFLAAS